MDAIILDFDGPLFDGRLAASRALSRLLKAAQAADELADLPDEASDPDEVLRGEPLRNSKDTLTVTIAKLGGDMGLAERWLERYREFLREEEDSLELRADVLAAVKTAVTSGAKIGIVSNRSQSGLDRLLAENGVSHVFGCALGASDERAPKPSVQGLEEALGLLGVGISDAAFVGDGASDVAAAGKLPELNYFHCAFTGELAPYDHGGTVLSESASLASLIRAAALNPPVLASPEAPPSKLLEALESGDLVVFAGAGVSIPSALGGWSDSYGAVLREAGLTNANGLALPEAIDIATQLIGWDQVSSILRNQFAPAETKEPNGYHYSIARLRPFRIWTTNYDHLFEEAGVGKLGYVTVRTEQELQQNVVESKYLIKMHGDLSLEPSSIVISQQQFDQYEISRRELSLLLRDDYRNRCILFVGVSFDDPALRRIIGQARSGLERVRYGHFILKRRSRDPLERWVDSGKERVLEAVHISPLSFERYEQILQFVSNISLHANDPIIGIAGSVDLSNEGALPGGNLCVSEIDDLSAAIGGALAKAGFRLTSGCGPRVGERAVEAAFGVSPDRARNYLRIGGGSHYRRTAPAVVVPSSDYSAVRERYLSESAVLLVLGGRHGTVGGVKDEIEIAKQKGLPAISFPTTGGAAYDLLPEIQRHNEDVPGGSVANELIREVAAADRVSLQRFVQNSLADGIRRLLISANQARVFGQGGRARGLYVQW